MSKLKKIILLIFTLYPIVFMIAYFMFMVATTFTIFSSFDEPSSIGGGSMMFTAMPAVFLCFFLSAIISIILTVIYIIMMVKNENIQSDMRIIWVLVILFGGMIAMPIYWHLYIWKDKKINELSNINDVAVLSNTKKRV